MRLIFYFLLTSFTLFDCKNDRANVSFNKNMLEKNQDLTAIRCYTKLYEVKYVGQDSLLKMYTKILREKMSYIESFELIDSFVSTLDSYSKTKFYIDNIQLKSCSKLNDCNPPSKDINPSGTEYYFNQKLLSEKNNEKFILEYLLLEKFFICDRSLKREIYINCLLNQKSIRLSEHSFIVTKDSCYNINKKLFIKEN